MSFRSGTGHTFPETGGLADFIGTVERRLAALERSHSFSLTSAARATVADTQFIGDALEVDTDSYETVASVTIEVPEFWTEYEVSAFYVGSFYDAELSPAGPGLQAIFLRASYDGTALDERTLSVSDPVEDPQPISHVEHWSGQIATGARTLLVEAKKTSSMGDTITLREQRLVASVRRTA